MKTGFFSKNIMKIFSMIIRVLARSLEYGLSLNSESGWIYTKNVLSDYSYYYSNYSQKLRFGFREHYNRVIISFFQTLTHRNKSMCFLMEPTFIIDVSQKFVSQNEHKNSKRIQSLEIILEKVLAEIRSELDQATNRIRLPFRRSF